MAVIGALAAGLTAANAIALTVKNAAEAADKTREVLKNTYNDAKDVVKDIKNVVNGKDNDQAKTKSKYQRRREKNQ